MMRWGRLRKRGLSVIWLAVLGLVLLAATAWAATETFQGFPIVRVVLDGQPVTLDVPAINFNGRTLLPLRALAELLDVNVTWDDSTKTAVLQRKTNIGGQSQQSTPVADSLSPDEVRKIKAFDQKAFEAYLQEHLGSIGGIPLEFLVVRDDLFGFYMSNSDYWRKLGYSARLDWVKRLAQIMDARFEGKPFGASLTLRLEYSSYPSSYQTKEVTLSESGKWVVRHRVLAAERFDLGSFGLQPVSVTVQN